MISDDCVEASGRSVGRDRRETLGHPAEPILKGAPPTATKFTRWKEPTPSSKQPIRLLSFISGVAITG